MDKEDIRIEKVIVHIMDSTVGMAVLSDKELEYGSDIADFLKGHIAKIMIGDESRHCEFHREESEIYKLLVDYDDKNFIPISRDIANVLYSVMEPNPDILPADLMVVRYRVGEEVYLGILKMNYKAMYTHRTMPVENGNSNEVILHKSILPPASQRLTEAAVIRMSDLTVNVIEKKYEVNGEKVNYFSYMFLKCSAKLSPKAQLSIVNRAVENVQKETIAEEKQYEAQMRAKSIIQETLQEKGGFTPEEIGDKIFREEPQQREAFQDQLEKYDIVKDEIKPKSETTVKKYQNQHLYTDTGIEIKIPMEMYKDPGQVEFITNQDGTVSVLIKNIEHLEAKF